jgi:hypothetical protein
MVDAVVVPKSEVPVMFKLGIVSVPCPIGFFKKAMSISPAVTPFCIVSTQYSGINISDLFVGKFDWLIVLSYNICIL